MNWGPERPRPIRQRALLRRWAAWGAQRAPEWFVRAAPPIIGALFACLLWTARRAVLRNIRRIQGRRSFLSELRGVVGTFVEFARALTAALAPERPLFRDREFDLRGHERATALMEKGQGVLILTAHVGPWDTAAMGLRSVMKVPVMMLMSPEADERTGQLHDSLRQAADVTVLRLGESSLDVLPVVSHLEAGGAVVAQMDRVPAGKPALATQLFSQDFAVPEGLFRLASITGVPIVPVFAARLNSMRDRLQVGPPLVVPPRASSEQLASCAQEVAGHLEAHLAQFPTQWFHFE